MREFDPKDKNGAHGHRKHDDQGHGEKAQDLVEVAPHNERTSDDRLEQNHRAGRLILGMDPSGPPEKEPVTSHGEHGPRIGKHGGA